MSSLIFHTEAEQVLVATDTLAVSGDGMPFMFTSKSFIVPHLRMIIAGTGSGGFCGKWFIQVNDRMILRGIDNLDFHTPRNLSDLWVSHKHELSIPNDLTTTIYHFGFSEEDRLIHAYAYRSLFDFKSERLEYGIGVKPECGVPTNYNLPEDIKKMMRAQRHIQSQAPPEQRVYIGGEIQIHHLTKNGFNVYTLDKFEDFDADERAIYENYNK
jgi:hypothetical protein